MHKSGDGTIDAHTTMYNTPQGYQDHMPYAFTLVKLKK